MHVTVPPWVWIGSELKGLLASESFFVLFFWQSVENWVDLCCETFFWQIFSYQLSTFWNYVTPKAYIFWKLASWTFKAYNCPYWPRVLPLQSRRRRPRNSKSLAYMEFSWRFHKLFREWHIWNLTYMEFSGLKKVQVDVYGIPYTSFATVLSQWAVLSNRTSQWNCTLELAIFNKLSKDNIKNLKNE